MNSKTEITQQSSLDTIKLAVALGVTVAAVVAFYYYAELSKLARIGGLVAAVVISVAIVTQTEKGRLLVSFIKESQIEVRKVVWPTRQETIQTTLVVLLVVVVAALFLWMLDLALGAIVQWVMG